MKYFKNISSLSVLKSAFRSLALENHPDRGGNTEVMQEINAEFDVLFAIWRNNKSDSISEHSDDQEGNEVHTGAQYRRNFYTANGWAGCRYDNNLSTKEIATRVRAYAKKRWPGYRWSVRTSYYSGGSSITLVLISGEEPAFIAGSKEEQRGYISTCRDVRDFSGITDTVANVVNDVCDYMASYNYDDCDGMQDYFDVNFYTHIYIGDYNKPYEVKLRKGSHIENATTSDSVESIDYKSESIIYGIYGNIEIVEYSEKAIAIFGDTHALKSELTNAGGRFNRSLRYKEGRCPGWIFSKNHARMLGEILSALTVVNSSVEDKRININAEAFEAVCRVLQKRCFHGGYETGKTYVKGIIAERRFTVEQLRYVAYLLHQARIRL